MGNLLQGDSNPNLQNQLELEVNASIHADAEFKRGLYSFSMVIDTFQGWLFRFF